MPQNHCPGRCKRPGQFHALILAIALISELMVLRDGIAAEPPSNATTVAVQLLDARTITGSIQSLTSDTLTLSIDGQKSAFPLSDVISLDVADPAGEPAPEAWLLLSNGDRAPLVPIDLVDDAFVCRWATAPDRPNCRVPLEFVTGVLRRPLTRAVDSSLLSELSSRAFSEDTLILSDGARLTGALAGVAAESFHVETAVGTVAVDAPRIAAVAMNAALVQRPAARESAALVTLRDGAWLTLHDVTLHSDGDIAGRTAFAAEFRRSLSDVVRIAAYGPRVVDLTLRTPAEIAVVPFVVRVPRMLVNRNARGGFLRVDGREYPRGFGMTSGMTVTFPLEPDDRRFQAFVGLDDVVGDSGSAVFTVDLDGRRLFTSNMLMGSDALLVVGPLDVADGERLTLSVEFAEYGNVQDVADWCDPILLR